ncbi:hypothetical protein BBBOND_0304190 [Babesia bigemina]|uniref:Uncharacterized protein n=1 Tax=Babesia bigemina TaxID=5866 RepID=A0A061DDS0_BABBI|nr:hypothetical protein BBBOND_0304190 [Babesia bigemina]CDR96515.1 hypothetical protein BBBOND_0304190 [Babesia bigemina]|eukprot:XP_012768701.1 hypothetical protein BBBOND_0304190 [Babesia bigemina]
MVADSLTQFPHDLKEGIDWLIALKGTDPENNLKAMGAALYDFLADKPDGTMRMPALEEVKHITREFLEKPEIKYQPFVRGLISRLNEPVDQSTKKSFKGLSMVPKSAYETIIKSRGANPKAIAEKLGKVVDGCENFLKRIAVPDQYKCAYSSKATWAESCAKDPEACAVVLVGIAPMLYSGLRSLQIVSRDAFRQGPNSEASERMEEVLEAVGYKEAEYQSEKGRPIYKALSGVDLGIFTVLYDVARYWALY